MLPAPPHWATSRPPGRVTAARLRNSASWSGTQWNVAVERTASTRPSIGSGTPRSATTYSIRSPKRASRSRAASTIDGEPSSAMTRPVGQALGELLGDAAAAAAGIEDALVAPERQAIEDRRAPARHRVGDAVVRPRVPVARHRRSPQAGCGRCLGGLDRPSGRSSRSPNHETAAPIANEAGRDDHRLVERLDRCAAARRRPGPASPCPCGGLSGGNARAHLRRVRVEPGRERSQGRVERRADGDEDDRPEERLPDPRDRVVDRRAEAGEPARDRAHERGRQRRDDAGDADPEQERRRAGHR